MIKEAACFNNPLIWASTSKNPQSMPTTFSSTSTSTVYSNHGDAALLDHRYFGKSLISLNPDTSLILETIKATQDQSGDIVIRLYESIGARGDAEITFHAMIKDVIKKIHSCNGLEEVLYDLVYSDGSVKICFKPFQIISLRIKLY